jgi:hypothetical protein
MANIRDILNSVPSTSKDDLFLKIEKEVKEYIDIHCSPHSIVYDSVDISPDYSQMISYCQICETDFTFAVKELTKLYQSEENIT